MILFLLALAGFLLTRLETRVAAGRDFQSRVMGDTASTAAGAYAAANYMALTENAAAVADGDTALTGELFAAGGGLNRAQAAYAHTAGASTYTLTKTFTSAAADGASRTIQKIGIFNAAAPTGPPAPTLVFETVVPSPPVMVPGDSVTITDTVTIT